MEFRGERILKWTLPGVGAAFNCHCLFGGAGKSCGLTSIRQNGRQLRTRGICQSPIWTWQIGVLANPFDVNGESTFQFCGAYLLWTEQIRSAVCWPVPPAEFEFGQQGKWKQAPPVWLNSFYYAVSLFCCFAVPGLINLRQFQSNAKFAENEKLKAEKK